MSGPLKTAVLISGRGSNMASLVKASTAPGFPARIALVLANNPDAGGLGFAKDNNIETCVINHRDFEERELFDRAMHTKLKNHGIELICLAGFMRLLTPWFVNKWKNRLINIHPSLLPAFKGLHTQKRALDAGCRFVGCTVHFVRPEMDEGPIIAQATIPVLDLDDEDSLTARLLGVEHKLYVHALQLVAEKQWKIDGNRVLYSDRALEEDGMQKPVISPLI